MDIINTKIEDILKFPFKEKDWFSTFGVYVIISLLSGFLVFFSVFFLFLGGAFILEDVTIGIFFVIPIFILIIVFFIANLYLQGYILEIINHIKEKKEEKPKHQDFGRKLRKGLDWLLLVVGPTSISIILSSISLGVILWGISFIETSPIIGIILIIAGALKSLLSILLIAAVSIMVLPSMLYIYLQTNSVVKGYCFRNVWKIIKNMWKEFLVVYAVSIILTMIISALGQMPCIGIFILMIGTAYTTFIIAFLVGRIFVQIDKLKLLQE